MYNFDDSDYQPYVCKHGNEFACENCDDEIGDIDKCLNCGRYKSSDQLNEDQVCRVGCRNPNEY